MRGINLLSLVQSKEWLTGDAWSKYKSHYDILFKDEEIDDLKILVEVLRATNPKYEIFNGYLLDYCIPQISKQFDLLRIGEGLIINIELKAHENKDAIIKQLRRNRYYLKFLGREVLTFCFVRDTRLFYIMNDNEELFTEESNKVSEILLSQSDLVTANIDRLFNPTNYLISPFNSPHEFYEGSYFLTGQQEEIKSLIKKRISENDFSINGIKGSAGTGKSLLAFDLAKDLEKERNVHIIHCGILNEGHFILKDNYKLNILPIKGVLNTLSEVAGGSVIIIDEAQRLYPIQLDRYIRLVKRANCHLVICYDSQQYFSRSEEAELVVERFEQDESVKVFELSKTIRSNKNIVIFTQLLFRKNDRVDNHVSDHIEVYFFSDLESAKEFIITRRNEGWRYINYTPSTKNIESYQELEIHSGDPNVHGLIGQEFNDVVVAIDEDFYYRNGVLLRKGNPYYLPEKMLHHMMTRAKERLAIVIIKNEEVLKRCLEILR